MSTPTCLTCRLFFDKMEDQRLHFKSDFHRFNLKRKTTGLAPVTQSQFEAVIERLNLKDNEENVETRFQCKTCKKNFSNEANLNQHFQSKKHRLTKVDDEDDSYITSNVRAYDDDSGDEEDIELLIKNRMEDPNSSLSCLFCSNVADSLDLNVQHMRSHHGFVIPYSDYLTNLDGLIKHLSVKVFVAYVCIRCDFTETSGRCFKNHQAAQAHMRDCAHCSFEINEENEPEFQNFFDFKRHKDDFISPSSILNNYFELRLPSNKVLVHRDLALTYKQPVGKEIIVDEELEELEKQVIAQNLQRKIEVSVPVEQVQKKEKVNFNVAVKGNDVLRRRWNHHASNCSTIHH